MICKETGEDCRTPSMCAPFEGCTSRPEKSIRLLEERVAKLERIIEHICPDKSADV